MAMQYQPANGFIGIAGAVATNQSYTVCTNSGLQIVCTSVAANFVSASADYYF
jgi:hypothetical protein